MSLTCSADFWFIFWLLRATIWQVKKNTNWTKQTPLNTHTKQQQQKLSMCLLPSSTTLSRTIYTDTPHSLQNSSSIATFKSALKTYLFPTEHWTDCCIAYLCANECGCGCKCVCACVWVCVCACVCACVYMYAYVGSDEKNAEWSVAMYLFI